MARTLLTNGTLLTVNAKREIINQGAVLINENKIEEIGFSKDLEEMHPSVKRVDLNGMLVMPGLINAHVHAAHILLRGGPSQDQQHLDWLVNVLYAAIHNYDELAIKTAYQLFSIEAIKSGTTTIIDNIVWGNRDELTTSVLDVMKKVGIRTVIAYVFSDISSPDQDALVQIVKKQESHNKSKVFKELEIDDILTSIEQKIQKYNSEPDDMIQIWPAPGIPLFVSPEGLKGAAYLADQYNTGFTIHLAETKTTSSYKDLSVIEYLDYLEILNDRLLAAHCVWVDNHDLRLLRRNKVNVVNNVVSNMFLGSGIAPISQMVDLGITVGLGTDDVNCNNSANMFIDMKFCALAQKARELNASAITAEKVIEMATIDGAKSIGMEHVLGSLEPGKYADLIVVDQNKPNLKPCFHIPSTLVYQANGTEVDSVMVNGQWLMKNQKILFLDNDLQNILDASQKEAINVLGKSGMEYLSNRGWISYY